MSTVDTKKKNVKYIVKRNGVRVSDREHYSENDAKNEYEHWNGIINRWPDGSKLEIVPVN